MTKDNNGNDGNDGNQSAPSTPKVTSNANLATTQGSSPVVYNSPAKNLSLRLPLTLEPRIGSFAKPPPPLDLIADPVQHQMSSLSDQSALNLVNRAASNPEFINFLKIAFARAYDIKSSNLKIIRFEDFAGEDSKGVNSLNHFVIEEQEGAKNRHHVKAAFHGKYSDLEARYIEASFYKLNQILRVGPDSNAIMVKDSQSDNTILMIVTQDLSQRGASVKKEVSFQDNETKEEGRKRKRAIADTIPEKSAENDRYLKENINRCIVEMVMNLCFYCDVINNYGNTGFKITREKLESDYGEKIITKTKPFIIDFKCSVADDIIRKIKRFTGKTVFGDLDELKKEYLQHYRQDIGQRIYENIDSSVNKNVINFKEDTEVFQGALKKLFLDKDGEITKFQNAITESFEFACGLISDDSDKKSSNVKKLDDLKLNTIKQIEFFLADENISKFLEQESQKIKPSTNARSPSPDPKLPSTSKRAKNNSGNSPNRGP